MIARARMGEDRGETLVELLVAIGILGLAGVAVLGGMMLSVRVSSVHRNEATSGTLVRSAAEAVQQSIDSAGKLASCASAAATYAAAANTAPGLTSAGFPRATVVANLVQSWTSTGWGSCNAKGIQRVQLNVQTSGDASHQANEKLYVVLRAPCASAGTTPCP